MQGKKQPVLFRNYLEKLPCSYSRSRTSKMIKHNN